VRVVEVVDDDYQVEHHYDVKKLVIEPLEQYLIH
jgi:hypothetical protein